MRSNERERTGSATMRRCLGILPMVLGLLALYAVFPDYVKMTAKAALMNLRPGGYSDGFEAPDYDGSSDGTELSGQNGWYIPVAGSNPLFVFTYEDNALQLPANATGETQFIGTLAPGNDHLNRAQLDFDWSTSSVWTVSYDLCAQWAGTGNATDYISSFSLQDSTTARSFTQANGWVSSAGQNWRAYYIIFNAAGQQQNPVIAGPAWGNLDVNHWYRVSTTFDFDLNKVISVSITDVDTGDTMTAEPDGWYLLGGAQTSRPLPTGLRFFVGGGADGMGSAIPGNIGGFDNLDIESAESPHRGEPARPISFPIKPGAVIE